MAKGSSLYKDQTPDQSNVSAHKLRQLLFLKQSPSFLDCVPNMVTASHLLQYKEYYKIPKSVKFILLDGRIAWNPPDWMVAVYGLMLNCRVTLPLQPLAQLVPNGYRTLMALCALWRSLSLSDPSPNEIQHCYQLRPSPNEPDSHYFASFSSVKWLPISEKGKRVVGKLDISDEKKRKELSGGFPL
ncbi:hypothetical protein ACOSP7_013923 [Xanthoceras sorbifolium]